MSIGKSGRIVIEVEPELKQKLYGALKKEQRNLKEWFLGNVTEYLADGGQFKLQCDSESEGEGLNEI